MRASCLAIVLLLARPVQVPTETAEGRVQRAALDLGQALVRGDAARLGPLLPLEGKVRLRVVAFGPEDGSYSAEQVEALFKDFLREGRVRSFDLLRVHCTGDQFATVRARAKVLDGEGRPSEIDLHLTFQPEGQRWVLRELREAPP